MPEDGSGEGGTAPPKRKEPVVRIHFADAADEARCRRALERLGLVVEAQLIPMAGLAVRDASPDEVNEALVAGGARGRTVARERIGQLVGWLIDREGDLEGRVRNVRSLVERVLSDSGLKERWAPRDDAALLAAARALHERIQAEGAPFVSWDAFVDAFCVAR
jgi:hypothetical protein